jgi:hypothetical protein
MYIDVRLTRRIDTPGIQTNEDCSVPSWTALPAIGPSAQHISHLHVNVGNLKYIN